MAKLVPSLQAENPMEKKINWAAWTEEQRRFLDAMPLIEGSSVDLDRVAGVALVKDDWAPA